MNFLTKKIGKILYFYFDNNPNSNIMKAHKFLINCILFLGLFLVGSCGKSDEEKLNKEREELTENLNGTICTVYKGMKVLMRSANLEKNLENGNFNNAKINEKLATNESLKKFVTDMFSKIKMDSTGTKIELSFTQTFELFRSLLSMKKELKNVNEDDYPTLLEVIINLQGNNAVNENDILNTLKWNSSKEHLILAAALEAAPTLPKDFKLYEISLIKSETLNNSEMKPLSEILRSITFFTEGWYFLADEAISKSIHFLENEKLVIEYPINTAIGEIKIQKPEDEITLLHGISYGFRGMLKTLIDSKKKNKEAVADLEIFLTDAQKLGLNNEITWMAGAYVALKKEDNLKAIEFLTKLKNSSQFNEQEKAILNKTIAYINEREQGKAMNLLYDKVFIGKLVFGYFMSIINQVHWHEKVSQSKAGKNLLNLPNLFDKQYQKVANKLSFLK